jgi:hypothetical protein
MDGGVENHEVVVLVAVDGEHGRIARVPDGRLQKIHCTKGRVGYSGMALALSWTTGAAVSRRRQVLKSMLNKRSEQQANVVESRKGGKWNLFIIVPPTLRG